MHCSFSKFIHTFHTWLAGKFVLEVATGVEAHVQSTLSVNGASDGPTVVARLQSAYEGKMSTKLVDHLRKSLCSSSSWSVYHINNKEAVGIHYLRLFFGFIEEVLDFLKCA